MIPFIMKEYKNTQLNGVEVGVHRGTHAYFMLSVLSMQKLFLVDPYLPYVDGDGKEWNVSNEDYAVAQRDLGRFKQCQFIRKTSLDAVADVQDDLDFVYIDANHSYECVKEDIEAWYPKVRAGGVIGGHDFTVDYQGVIYAVVEFARRTRSKLFVESADWWIVKGVND